MLQEKELALEQELASLLNRHCVENESDTPDFILAAYLLSCLDLYKETVRARDKWFGITSPWAVTKEKGDF